MPSIQIKNVPEETHAVLRRRAAAANQSLQEYMLSHLERFTREPTMNEILDRISTRSGGSIPLDVAVEYIREERDRR